MIIPDVTLISRSFSKMQHVKRKFKVTDPEQAMEIAETMWKLGRLAIVEAARGEEIIITIPDKAFIPTRLDNTK